MEETEQKMLKMHDDLCLFIINQIKESNDPLAIAAVMMTTAMRLYRTALSDQDFEEMMDVILDSRNRIQKFDTTELDRNKLN